MQNYRWVTTVIVAGVCALGSATVPSNAAPQDGSWQTGDIFVGVGYRQYLPGQYWVFDAQGNRKQVGGVDQIVQDQWPTHADAWAAATTGCMVNPAGTALFTTSFAGRTISQFVHSPSNGALVNRTVAGPLDVATAYDVVWNSPTDLRPWPLMAIETIVFDKDGDYYVGGQGPWLEEGDNQYHINGKWGRPSWIFKFDGATHQLEPGWPVEVPSGANGVDQLDLGTDTPQNPVLYYTSEDMTIRVFRPNITTDNPADHTDRFGEMPLYIRDGAGNKVFLTDGGVLYSLRALPPAVPAGEPSGFLVASSADVLRVGPDGEVVMRYEAEGIAGQRFALNVTPDGGSFWTASHSNDLVEWYPHVNESGNELTAPDPDGGFDGYPNAVGWLIQYHIATGAELKRVRIDAGTVWGLCIQREYTAGTNTCYDLDAFGNPLDSDNDGVFGEAKPCTIPPNCSATGSTTGDCKVPGLPELTAQLTDTWNYAGTPVAGYPHSNLAPIATSPLGHQLTYSVSYGDNGAVNGISFDANTGNFFGTIAQYANATTHTITVTVTDTVRPKLSVSRTFKWEVRLRSGNQAPLFTSVTGHSLFGNPAGFYGSRPELPGVIFQVTELAPHQITYTAKDDEFDSLWVAATYQVLDRAQFALGNVVPTSGPLPGLPPGYVVANHVGAYQNLTTGALSATPCAGCAPVRSPGQFAPEIGVPPGYAIVGVTEAVAVNFAATSAAPENLYRVDIAITDNPNDGGGWKTSDLEAAKQEHAWLRAESSRSFILDVVNRAPVFAPSSDGGANPPNQTTKAGTSVNYFVGAVDSDGSNDLPLTYQFDPATLPVGLTGHSNGFVTGVAGLPVGSLDFTSTVKVTITDAAGKWRAGTFTWRVYTNNVPDCSAARPTQSLWPPNHTMVEIGILGVTDADNDQLTITIGEIWQDEKVDAIGSGRTVQRDAWPGANGTTAWVRAERTGVKGVPGDGRVYRIFFTAADATDSCTGSVLVGVPHDQGGIKIPVPNAFWWNSQSRLPIPGPIPPLPPNYPY